MSCSALVGIGDQEISHLAAETSDDAGDEPLALARHVIFRPRIFGWCPRSPLRSSKLDRRLPATAMERHEKTGDSKKQRNDIRRPCRRRSVLDETKRLSTRGNLDIYSGLALKKQLVSHATHTARRHSKQSK